MLILQSGQGPLVSIVICNYNYARLIRCAVCSALAQTYKNIEIIVVDDGSTDSSRAAIDEFVLTGAVKAIYQNNEGQYSAYNAGFAASSGDIVMFLDADDIYLPDAARMVVAAMNAGTAKAHFRLSFIGPQGEERDGHTPRELSSGAVGHLLATRGLLYSSAPGSGNAYAREALTDLFPLPVTEDKHGADFFTVYGSCLKGMVVAVDSVLGHYRLHRSRSEEKASLVFGNAAKLGNERERLKARISLFRLHIKRRLGIDLPERLVSFSTQKQEFVVEALRETRYVRRLVIGQAQAAPLWYALKNSPDFSVLFKSCLVIWAVLVVVLPRALALPLARYVSNAASREGLKLDGAHFP
ncbi:glycosyltransferase family 2 protein [Caenimonas soli]|uniref:glycosyltransferase family 2 protein n=1 Tax=Caenimonas soli TaxID=2735555 RepID=UPI001557497C|nr:glycosyltransferase family A protein [Caenimonas soli]NPC57467.1 glycosyltransferase [Caenimonas soli]